MPSTIHLFIAASLTDCLAMQPAPDLTPPSEVVVLPSSLDRRDRSAAAVRAWLRSIGISSHLLTPEPLIASALGRRTTAWQQVALGDSNATGPASVALPTRLASARVVWSVTDIDQVGGRGPYVLDLPIRYANLATRLAMLGLRHHASLAVSVLRARPFANHVIVRHFPRFTLLATTLDPIAAELLSLSLVDELLPQDSQVTGPWEDDVVQRATEHEFGVRLPSDITVTVEGSRHAAIDAVIGRILARFGVSVDQVTSIAQE